VDTIQFEGVKVAIKQDRTGYVLTLSVHPDDVPEALLRDFVGARYQIVMVRIDENEQPYKRKTKLSNKAAMLCKDKLFQQFLMECGLAWDMSEKSADAFIKETCCIESKSSLDSDEKAISLFNSITMEFNQWKTENLNHTA
jgi:hypothetical protein